MTKSSKPGKIKVPVKSCNNILGSTQVGPADGSRKGKLAKDMPTGGAPLKMW